MFLKNWKMKISAKKHISGKILKSLTCNTDTYINCHITYPILIYECQQNPLSFHFNRDSNINEL